jgi:hypothetical protein
MSVEFQRSTWRYIPKLFSVTTYPILFSTAPTNFTQSIHVALHAIFRALPYIASLDCTLAGTVAARSSTGIVRSNPTQGMNVCVRLFCVFAVLCAGSGFATGTSSVQGVLPTA